MGWCQSQVTRDKSAGFLDLRPGASAGHYRTSSPIRTTPISCLGGKVREESEGEGEDLWAELANGVKEVGM